MQRGRKPEGKEMPPDLFRKLIQARLLAKRIKRQKLIIEALETILLPNSPQIKADKVQESPVNNLEEVAVEIIEAKKKLVLLQGEMLEAVRYNIRWIEMIENENVKDVMVCRYIDFCSQEETGVHLHYSVNHVQRLENKGKKELTRIARCGKML